MKTAIAYRDCDGFVVLVLGLDGNVFVSTIDALNAGYDVLYK